MGFVEQNVGLLWITGVLCAALLFVLVQMIREH